jgi:hypothetical protein
MDWATLAGTAVTEIQAVLSGAVPGLIGVAATVTGVGLLFRLFRSATR